MTNEMSTTIWSVNTLVEMSKAQLVAVWNSQPRLSYVDCMAPKTKRGYVLAILSLQEKAAAK
jgi:hypothetical protein